MSLASTLQHASQQAHNLERTTESLRMVCHWIVQAHDNPSKAPQPLEFQIKQLKEILARDKYGQ